MVKKYLTLDNIDCYKRSFTLSQYVWKVVIGWEWFSKRTIGIQYIRAVDSISSTVAEGFGRYFKKDKILFYRYGLGSVSESLDWTEKSWNRKLLEEEQYTHIKAELECLPREIYQLINFTTKKLKK